jgi:hypothetical protein
LEPLLSWVRLELLLLLLLLLETCWPGSEGYTH